MHQLIERLQGVEVITDDFMIVGFGKTEAEAICNHDQNLNAFLQRCMEWNVWLNAEKVRLRQKEVPFIGHVATGDGLRADPAKVHAILEMPPPTDVPVTHWDESIPRQVPVRSLRYDEASQSAHLERCTVELG